ncbi:MAG TPA: phosphoglycerate dehydrogenase [Puia sp.]|nr:phosphoglycerate dehydrogenase [Puia sp.]
MASYTVKTYNSISNVGLDRFGASYSVGPDGGQPDAIMLRSFDLHSEPVADSVLAVARAGAGVNNIPVDKLTERGIAVFNTPGANANAVKELVLSGMLMAARNLPQAMNYTLSLGPDNMKEAVEAGKKQFAGFELLGKTLGVIGLGAIGRLVARAAIDLGMAVIGYDPALPSPAKDLPPELRRSKNLKAVLENSDLVTIHVPLVDGTKNLINEQRLGLMKPGAVLLNFSRDQIVDEEAALAALDAKKLSYYVTDFPTQPLLANERVISLPHLGASTSEAEDNCAVMAADQLQRYLEDGTTQFSVNLPAVELGKTGGVRLTLIHANKPDMMAQFTQAVSDSGQNIAGLANGSRGEVAYTIMDLDSEKIGTGLFEKLSQVPGMIRTRVIS